MLFSEESKKAFDFAADATKQLITVATGVITLTVIFSKDLDKVPRYWAMASWVVLIISVCFGIFVLLIWSGQLRDATEDKPPSIDAGSTPSIIQVLSFLVGLALLMICGFTAVAKKTGSASDATKGSIRCLNGPSSNYVCTFELNK